jgi:hypothetical protein
MEVNVRFRHTQGGDIGPFAFLDTVTIQEMKDRLLQEWPKGGHPQIPHSSFPVAGCAFFQLSERSLQVVTRCKGSDELTSLSFSYIDVWTGVTLEFLTL